MQPDNVPSDGIAQIYWPNGKMKEKSYRVNNKRHGQCITYGRNGKEEENTIYLHGMPICDLNDGTIDRKDYFVLTLKYGIEMF